MTLYTEEERQLWKDAVLRTVKSDNTLSFHNDNIADGVVTAYRERLPKPVDTPEQKSMPEEEAPAVQMEWRDARPEDAEKGFKCRVRDYNTDSWSECWEIGFAHQILQGDHSLCRILIRCAAHQTVVQKRFGVQSPGRYTKAQTCQGF